MTDIKPFDLRHAGNEIHLVSSVLGKITEQTAQRFQNHVCHVLNHDTIITPEVTLKHDILHANTCEEYFRNWIIVDDDIKDLSVARVSRSLACSLTDLSSGGSGTTIQRSFEEHPHPSEGRILNIIVNHLLDELSFAYSALTPTTLRLASDRESTGAEHHVVYKSAIQSCMSFHIKAGKAQGTISILYPTSQFSTDAYFSDGQNNKQDQLSALKHRILDVQLPVTAILARHETTLSKMLELEPGDIIPIECISDAEILIADKTLGTGQVLTDDHNLLVQITERTDH